MSENKNSTDDDGSSESRPVLGDVTNRPGKRTVSMVSGDSTTVKSGDGCVKNVDDNEGDSIIAKRVCLGVDRETWISECVDRACKKVFAKFDWKKSIGLAINSCVADFGGKTIPLATAEIPGNVNESLNLPDASLGVARDYTAVHSVMEVGGKNIVLATSDIPNEVNESFSVPDASLGVARADTAVHSVVEVGGENIALATSDIPNEVNESFSVPDASAGVARADTAVHNVMEVGDVSRDSCVFGDGDCKDIGGSTQEDEGRVTSGVTHSSLLPEVSGTNICVNDSKDLSAADLTSSKCGSIDFSRLDKSSGSKLFELERCRVLKGDGSSNSSANLDLIKACSCSFCLKAAYILSDLHYQDIKGRIAASKRSQKEANNLVQRCRLKESNTHGHGNSNKSLKLEHDLMGQWRSLFLHMEDRFVSESNQLEGSYLALKELRENCKTNLEMINGMPSDKE